MSESLSRGGSGPGGEAAVKAVVTGSSGFIGSNLLAYLESQGFDVLGLDKSEPLLPDTVRRRSVQCDILDQPHLLETISGFAPAIVFHLAARTDLDETRDLRGYAANVDGVRNVIKAVREAATVRRAIFTSSQLVCRIGYVPANDRDYQPNTLYGQSKVLTEEIVRELDGGGAEWCLVRPTTVWGPGMSRHYQRAIRMIERGRYFHVGHDALYKSYSYIGNIVYQYLQLAMASAPLIQGKTFYLADYEPLSLRDWLNEIGKGLGARAIPSVPRGAARAAALVGDLLNAMGFHGMPFNSFRLTNILTEYQFDLSSTQEVCGPLPYEMKHGVRELVAWLKARDSAIR